MRRISACLVSLIWCTASAAAQSPSEVRLSSTSGDFSITGTLMRVENETYVIATSIGTLRIATDAVTCAGAACPDEPDVSIYANARLGEPVALKGASLMISGTLKAFENQTYTVETKIGDMTIPAMGVACEGPGCPEKAMVPATHLAPAITEGS